MRWVETAAVLFITLALTSCGRNQPADGKIGLEFNDQCYRIPKWNARLINASAGFPFSERRKSNSSLLLRFYNAELRERIPEYESTWMYDGKPMEGVMVSFNVPSPDELAQIRRNEVVKQKEFFSLWYAEGDWTNRTLEPSPVPGLFRISHFPNGHSWFVVTRMPDMQTRDTHLAKDFWIAICSDMEGTTHTSCLLDIEQDGIFMNTDTPEPNLPFREQLGNFYREKLDSWKVACDGGS